MDLIRQELANKRKALTEATGGRKTFKRTEIEQKRLHDLREQEKRELQSKQHRTTTTTTTPTTTTTTPSTSTSTPKSPTRTTDEKTIDDLDLPKPEVIRRLRLLKQPVTLFGEDDAARLERMKFVLQTGMFEVDSDMTEGQTNDFLRDIVEMKKRQKSGVMGERRKRKSEDLEDGEGGNGGEDDMSGDGGSDGGEADKDWKRMKANFEDLCDEDKILVFFKKLLNEWNQELNEMGDQERRTAKGKQMVATCKQCARYLHPLFKFCRKKVLPDDIKKALMIMVNYCIERDYLAAMDHYIKLAIGNAPWPIGVTMVGIHERSAREKIYTNSVAHIMNDETTRKYLQSIKRLMTFCQRRYPTMPSKAVEFNSLANGSDLQSLLMEEERRSSGSQASDDKFKLLCAAPKDT